MQREERRARDRRGLCSRPRREQPAQEKVEDGGAGGVEQQGGEVPSRGAFAPHDRVEPAGKVEQRTEPRAGKEDLAQIERRAERVIDVREVVPHEPAAERGRVCSHRDQREKSGVARRACDAGIIRHARSLLRAPRARCYRRRIEPTRRQLLVILFLAAIPRLAIAWTDHALFWPDEIYQGLEQAHRVVFGYGFVPWEFQEGARPWVFPGFLAAIFRVSSLVGVDDSRVLVSLARTAMVALALAGIAASMRLAARLSDSPATATVAASLAGVTAAFLPLALVFDSRCLAEAASAPLVAIGALLLLPKGQGDWKREAVSDSAGVGAGVLLGVACFLRFQVGLIALGLAVIPLVRRRPREAAAYAAGGIAAAVAGGALDFAIWGRPFHSFFRYLAFHLPNATGEHAGLAPLPFWWYAEVAWSSAGPAVLVVAAGVAVAAVRAPRTRVLLGVVAVFFVAHAILRQKEFRYLLSIAPVAAALFGVGASVAWDTIAPRVPSPWRARVPVLAALLLGSALAARSASASFEQLGQYRGMDLGRRSPWHFERDVNLLLHEAGTRADLCGLAMSHGRNMVWHGGYTYLHRDVPVLGLWGDPRLHLDPTVNEAANYALVPATLPALPGFTPVAAIGTGALLRREGACVPHPELDHRLFERE